MSLAASPNHPSSRVAVIIASMGRPECLATMIRRLRVQTLAPSRIILSVAAKADIPRDADLLEGVEVAIGPKGLPTQRNTGLRVLAGDCDVVAFFDDDYIPSATALEHAAAFFAAHPEVVGANGLILADGINSPGISTEEAIGIVERFDAQAAAVDLTIHEDLEGLYGCNMIYRVAAIGDTRFDERLKLYGWQEDIDFAVKLSRHGRTVKSKAFAGVHQGVKGARTSGFRFGYSQVINPLYLMRKGTMSRKFALRLMLVNLLANHVRVFRPEPWVDRRGRLRGNWLGLWDAVNGRLTPERIETL
jgi:GT2 family glycosyltransferase